MKNYIADIERAEIVSSGGAKFRNENNSCIIITHNAHILKHLQVNRAHVFLNRRIVKSGGSELVDEVTAGGYAQFEVTS